MTDGLDEDTVDFKPNYDGKDAEPVVLPAAFPNLLVNGASGIAVGMATNCPPHNLVEVVQALRHLIKHPDAEVDELMRFIPGPDLPTGGKIIGLDGIRDAYHTGRGSFRIRATARIEQVHPRRKGIVVTELPYLVGPERVIEQIKNLVTSAQAAGHRRRQGPVRPDQRHSAGDRGEERVQPRRPARAALQADQDGGQLRDQRGRAGRGSAADPHPARAADGLPRAPLRGDPAADRVRPAPRPPSGCTWSRAC